MPWPPPPLGGSRRRPAGRAASRGGANWQAEAPAPERAWQAKMTPAKRAGRDRRMGCSCVRLCSIEKQYSGFHGGRAACPERKILPATRYSAQTPLNRRSTPGASGRRFLAQACAFLCHLSGFASRPGAGLPRRTGVCLPSTSIRSSTRSPVTGTAIGQFHGDAVADADGEPGFRSPSASGCRHRGGNTRCRARASATGRRRRSRSSFTNAPKRAMPEMRPVKVLPTRSDR